MFDLIATLMKGANARATEAATDVFAIDLINQKIREAEAGLSNAKAALAALILRQRKELQALDQLVARKRDLETRAKKALDAGNEGLAADAASAIADLENEETVRRQTLERLAERIGSLRLSVEKANRRIVDLRSSASAAAAIDLERKAQRRVNRALNSTSPIHEAEALIRRVSEQDDPLAQSEVLDEIDASLSHENVTDRLAEAGFGDARKVSADDVLARLRTKPE